VDAVDADCRGAVEHDVETGSRESLAENLLAVGKPLLGEDVDDLLTLWSGQVREQGESGDRVGELTYRHVTPLRPARPRTARSRCHPAGERRPRSFPPPDTRRRARHKAASAPPAFRGRARRRGGGTPWRSPSSPRPRATG